MTISTTASRVEYAGNGVTTVFPIPFRFLENSHIIALLVSSSGVSTTWALSTNYTLAGADADGGGTLTALVAPAVGTRLVIYRDVPATQETDYISGDPFPAESHERALDKLTMLAQQDEESLDRAIKLPVSDVGVSTTLPAASQRLDRMLSFDATTGAPEVSDFTHTQVASAVGAAYAAGALADAVTYTPEGTGAVSRSVQAKIRADVPVSPEDKGAAGDGATYDTASLIAALATGRDVWLSAGKTYRCNADLEITTNFQRLGGPGVLKFEGNCGVVIKGGCVGACVDVVVNSSSHTGVAVKVDGAHRSRISLYAIDCYDGIYVSGANVCNIDWMWGQCRNKGITWYGTTSVRSDILHIRFALFSVGAGKYGLDWDGNCHSLEVDYLGIVCGSSVSAGNGYGAIVRNTSGGTAPAIGKFNHIEVDYSGTHAIEITAGSDYDISLPYLLGATGSGIKTSAGINDYEVRVASGKSRGHTRYAIEATGGVVLLDGSMDLSSNGLGEVLGSVWTKTPRLSIDAQHYLAMASGNPLHTWDSTDYTGYDRTNNTLADFIGGTAILSRSAARVTSSVPVRVPVYTVAGLPGVSVAGDTAFASNGRKNGEGGGAGTGVLVFSDGSAWRACDTGATVAA